MTAAFVLDASITMAWCFEDEASAYADAILDSLTEHEAVVPEIWALEVSNVLAVAEQRQRIDQAGSILFVSRLEQLPISVQRIPTARIFDTILALARQYRLSSYDASYLDLAMRLGLPLATADARLREAAEQAGVALYLD